MIRAIFFDLDDTLIRYNAAYELALAASHAVLAGCHGHVTVGDLRTAIYAAYEKRFGYGTPGFAGLGTLPVGVLRAVLTGDALTALGVAPEPGLIAELIAEHEKIEAQEIRPFADTRETIQTLARSFPLGVITNGPSAMQRGKLTALELTGAFRVIVVDSEFGHPKPDGRIFAHAAESVGFAPDELLFVGNSPEADVAGAVAAGWCCAWLNADGMQLPPGVPTPSYVLRTLAEVLEIAPVAEALRRD